MALDLIFLMSSSRDRMVILNLTRGEQRWLAPDSVLLSQENKHCHLEIMRNVPHACLDGLVTTVATDFSKNVWIKE